MTELGKVFVKVMSNLKEKEYMFNLITYDLAPTLYGHKAATLINLTKKNRNMYDLWKKYKEEYLKYVSLEAFEIKNTYDTITVLFYNKKPFVKMVKEKNNMEFLKQFGYDEKMTLEEILNLLKKRFNNSCPHEIGIFLGIPVEDVTSFIKKCGKDFVYCGYWKVYHNIDNALDVFNSYNEDKKKILKLMSEKDSLSEVIKYMNYSISFKKA